MSSGETFLKAIRVQEFLTKADVKALEDDRDAWRIMAKQASVDNAELLHQRDRYHRYFVWSFGFIMAEVAFATAYWIAPAVINWFIARWF